MTVVYLDWNVFNKIEKLSGLASPEKEVYTSIAELILQSKIITPYSNAHMSDLYRGFLKDPSFIEGHLQTLSKLTNNLCVVQYWGEPKVKWHLRSPFEFFESTKEESEQTAYSFSALFDEFDDQPLVKIGFEIQKTALRMKTVDPSFKKIYSVDPFFSTMFSRTKIDMNHLALCEDIYSFSNKIKSDYILYKNYRKFLNELRVKLPQYQKLYSAAQNKIIGTPKYLTWDEMWDLAKPDFKETSNTSYDKIIDLFTTTDLKGYRQDEKFANLMDDALHCFYAAQCQYFVTLDGRCYDKTIKVFEKLNIPTVVMKPEEFIKVGL